MLVQDELSLVQLGSLTHLSHFLQRKKKEKICCAKLQQEHYHILSDPVHLKKVFRVPDGVKDIELLLGDVSNYYCPVLFVYNHEE